MEVVSLISAAGTELVIEDPYVLITADWGDADVEAELATGTDVVGAAPGTHQRTTRQVVLEVGVNEYTGTDFVGSTYAIDKVIAEMQAAGGFIRRQQKFADGYSEELELEVLEVHPAHEPGVVRHKGWESASYTFTCNPGWLADEELLATDDSFTDTVKRLVVPAPRGNLPGPGRVVLVDNADQVRRWAELGGAFSQVPQRVEYRAGAFEVSEAAGDMGVDDDALGGHSLEVTPVIPVWTTVGILEDLPHLGSYRIRLRARGGEDDAQFSQRVVWRSRNGPWKDLGDRVTNPGTRKFYDQDAGALLHYDAAETIDVRVDVRASDFSSQSYFLDALTITPSELYAVARGVPVEQPDTSAVAFDDFNRMDDGVDPYDVAHKAAPEGGNWVEQGDTTPSFEGYANLGLTRLAADDSVADLGTGHFAILGTTDYVAVDNAIAGAVRHEGDKNTQSMVASLVRWVDADNWLMAVMRCLRKSSGDCISYAELYKATTADGIERLESQASSKTELTGSEQKNFATVAGSIGVSVVADGAYVVRTGSKGYSADPDVPLFEGTDVDLATGGALEEGRIGAYSLVQSDRIGAYTTLYELTAYATVPTARKTDIVRRNGIGVFGHDNSYSAEADGSEPQPFIPQGNRIWIPPLAGEITAKVRIRDSDVQIDEGGGADTAISVYHRPAFVTLSDALEV